MVTDPERINELARIAEVFTPSSPVRQPGVFAGREAQQERMTRAIFEPGRHVAIYGARGVGKTSLANVVGRSLTGAEGAVEAATRVTQRVPCGTDDDFDGLWRRLIGEIAITPITGVETFVGSYAQGTDRGEFDIAGGILDDAEFLVPATVERIFRDANRAVFIFDEYDAIADEDCRAHFAELIKMISDTGTGPTIVLIGVGHDIGSLVGHHESVKRCTEEIEMPPMTAEETRQLVHAGFALLGLEAQGAATEAVIDFSRGFPAFAHSLCKQAAETVTSEGRVAVTEGDIYGGAFNAIQQMPYSLGAAYEQAVDSRHPEDQTEMTLVASAWLAPGRFRPAEVKRLLEEWLVHISSPDNLESPTRAHVAGAWQDSDAPRR